MLKPIVRPLAAPSLLLSFAVAHAADTAQDAAKARYEMTTYQLCFFKEPPDAPELAAEALAAARQGHVDNLMRLVEAGRTVLLGPLEEAGAMQGVAVLDAPAADVDAAFADDPLVKAGQLVVERHPWYAAKGILRKPPEVSDLGHAWLGLLVRPADAPAFPGAELQEIQKGHMANIEHMAATGDLVIAGPMAEDGPLRGILVFRTESEARVRELVAADPALQKGRLKLELYGWRVPKGTFPDAAPRP